MNKGNQALNPDPRGVKLIFRPRNMENIVRFSSDSGGARRVVKLNVKGTLLLVLGLRGSTLDDRGKKHRILLRRDPCGVVSNCTYSKFSTS